jgi:hypothetical protein
MIAGLLLTGLDPDMLEESRDSRPSVGFADMTQYGKSRLTVSEARDEPCERRRPVGIPAGLSRGTSAEKDPPGLLAITGANWGQACPISRPCGSWLSTF